VSRRPGFVIDKTAPADGGRPPNQYHALVSVQVRCNFPPLARRQQVMDVLVAAYVEAADEVARMFGDETQHLPDGWWK
jgi:hypothetical protein